MSKNNGSTMQTWSAINKCGQFLTIRLSNEGELETKLSGKKKWQQIGNVDLSIFTVKDVRDMLKQDQNIRKLVAQKA